MRGLTALQPALALARYHMLAGIRAAHGVFLVILLLAMLGLLFGSPLFVPQSELVAAPPTSMMYVGSQSLSFVFVVHLIAIFLASLVVSAPRGELSDLMETAPFTPGARFLGDMLGALLCTVVIHLCSLPVLALTFALSPVSTTVFIAYELLLLSFVVFGAALSSWKRRSRGPASRARAVAVLALFATSMIIAVASTTRWPRFRDALGSFLAEPAPQRLQEVKAEIISPVALALVALLLYTAFIAFYAMRSIRLQVRAQEGLS